MNQGHSLSFFPGIPESPTDTPRDFIMPATPSASAAPPPTPLSWSWQCHRCHISYGFGVTRRCLECGHTMCTKTEPAADGKASGASSGRNAKQPQRRRRPRGGPCPSEFDFAGWKAWATWRRGQQQQQDQGRDQERERKRRLLKNTQNCSEDCTYPSECRHTRRRARQEQAARIMDDIRKQECRNRAAALLASAPHPKTLVVGPTQKKPNEAEQILASRAVVESAGEPRAPDGSSDNDSGDSSDPDSPGAGLTMDGSWPLPPAAGDDRNTLMISFSLPLGTSSTRAEDFSMRVPFSQQPLDDQAYDGDVESSHVSHITAERSCRSRRSRHRPMGADAFLSPPAAPSSSSSRDGSYQPLPVLAEEPEDCSSSSSSRSYSSLLSRPETRRSTRARGSGSSSSPASLSRYGTRGHSRSSSSASSSPPTTRSNSGGSSANEDLAELMRFRSAFMRGEL